MRDERHKLKSVQHAMNADEQARKEAIQERYLRRKFASPTKGNWDQTGLAPPQLPTTHAQAPTVHHPKTVSIWVPVRGELQRIDRVLNVGQSRFAIRRGGFGHCYISLPGAVGRQAVRYSHEHDRWIMSGS